MKLRPVFAISALTLIGIAAPVVMATTESETATTPTTIQLTSAKPVLTAPAVTTTTLSDLAILNSRPDYIFPYQEAYENGQISAREFVNGLYYSYGNPFPALMAYEVVAKDIGWSEEKIAQWRRFAFAVMRKETHWCPSPRGGARWRNNGRGCVVSTQGTGSDAGFGQITRTYFYAPGTPLCDIHKMCDADYIVSEPYISMESFLRTIDYSGSHPWCYTKAQIKHKTYACHFAPDSKYYDPEATAINFATDGTG